MPDDRTFSAPRSAWKEQASCKERHRKDQTAVKSIPQRAWVTRGLKPGKMREQAGADEANGITPTTKLQVSTQVDCWGR